MKYLQYSAEFRLNASANPRSRWRRFRAVFGESRQRGPGNGMLERATTTARFAERDLLASMEVQAPGRRDSDGGVSYSLFPPIRSMMFGPFLRLPAGFYCLTLSGVPGRPLQKGQPILGLEVIAQNRVLRGWMDVTAEELSRGVLAIYFEVPHELSIESGADAPFEFRMSAFGTCTFKVTRLALRSIDAADMPTSGEMTWRLLGRLRLLPLPGDLALTPLSIGALKLGRPWTPLFLPTGFFRLELAFRLYKLRRPDHDALDIRLVNEEGQAIASEVFSGCDLEGGVASFLFEMPLDMSYDSGAPQKLRVEIRHFGNVTIRLHDLRILRLSATTEAGESRPRRLAPKAAGGKKKILIFGNCQGGLLANAFRSHAAFSGQFSVKHHSMELPANLHEQGKRDLEDCNILLIQDIREWEQYPLRNYVPDTLQIVRYPCIRFASPWPFDAFNGPDDRMARNWDYPNFEFTYFDGLLARLRQEVPDHAARFQAYKQLDIKGVIDPVRLHAFEERRLSAMDKKFSTGIGAYILENFRKRPVFYTTAHPNGVILNMLLKQLARELEVNRFIWPTRRLDALRNLQIPVHPLVAGALGLKWADETTRYLVRGEKVTWEDYFRKYISYYG